MGINCFVFAQDFGSFRGLKSLCIFDEGRTFTPDGLAHKGKKNGRDVIIDIVFDAGYNGYDWK